MKLCHCSGLVALQVLQVEAAYQVVLAPDVLGDQVHLELVVGLEAVHGPVLVALHRAGLYRAAQAHNVHAVLLPDHLPEVGRCVY